MQARRAVRFAETETATAHARAAVDAAKRALGERGSVWWDDDAPDEGGKAPWNSSYADWWATLSADKKESGTS